MASMEVDPPSDDQMEDSNDDKPMVGMEGTSPMEQEGISPEVKTALEGEVVTSILSNSITVALHPLVIMNVADHWTRVRAQEDKKDVKVIGALLGVETGRHLEIMNSYELRFEEMNGENLKIDREYFALKEDQYKQVFPNLIFLGWYSNGEELSPIDIKIHKEFAVYNDASIYLKLNPFSIQTKLPVSIYQSLVDVKNQECITLFSPLEYTLETEDSERIGLDHMARTQTTTNGKDSGTSAVTEHLRVQYNAVKMLRDRVQLIRDLVQDVKSGKVPFNHEVMREAFNLCHRLPVISAGTFEEEFFNQFNDVGLQSYLAMLTKETTAVHQFVNKFNVLYERQTMGRRLKDFPFLPDMAAVRYGGGPKTSRHHPSLSSRLGDKGSPFD